MDRNFGGVIWTNHALDRLRERGIKQGDAWVTKTGSPFIFKLFFRFVVIY